MRARGRITAAAGALALVAGAGVAAPPAATGAAGPAPGAGTAASGPRVAVMVVGPDRVLRSPVQVRAPARTISVGRKRCRVGSGTPLAALLAARARRGPSVRVRDYGSCSRRAGDAGGLYVFEVGRRRAAGAQGWVYKVGRRAGTAGAADTAGPFGTGRRLRSGQRVTWFWCRMSRGGCQRTLVVRPDRRAVSRGARLGVTVRGYDDAGRARRVAGARVRLGNATAVTNSRGRATLRARDGGRRVLRATRSGMVPSFVERVAVR